MSLETRLYIYSIELVMYICFLITSLIDQKREKGFNPINAIFICYIGRSISCLISDCLGYTHSHYIMQYVVCAIYSLTGQLALFFYGIYYIRTCGASKKISHLVAVFNHIVLALNFLCTIPLIPSGLFFYVTRDGYYYRGKLFVLSYIFAFTEMLALIILSFFIQSNKMKAFGYIMFGALPLISSIATVFPQVSSSLTDMATMISCSILYSCVYIEDRNKTLAEEAQISGYKSDVMLSQIGPHFIYNTLATISALCVIDPEKAQTLTSDFSDYLRTNINLSQTERISSFDDELKHAQKYLEIEKVRFEERLNIEYDIKEKNFFLPSLSLQPIVENAVKHGIMKKRGGGTVKISTEKQNDYFVVRVTDDGVGFDVSELKPREGHYGLFTAKERIEMLLDGYLEFESTPDVGTTVSIFVKNTEAYADKGNNRFRQPN